MLPWAEFESLLCTCHPMESGPATLALRSTIDLTCSGHVSIFEFDIFTRLFQVREGKAGSCGRRGQGVWTPGSEEGGPRIPDSWVLGNKSLESFV